MIPFESPAIVGSSPCSDAVRSARGLFGDTPEAPRVSPKPYARSRTTRPPTANRPASAIPRDVRGKRNPARRPSAGCLLCNPRVASFRLAAPRTRTRPQTPPLREWTRACLSRGGSGGARRVAKSFSGPTGLATRRFTSRGRCGSESQRSYSPRGVLSGDARKSSERAAPRAAAVDKKPVCHCPVRKSGIRVPANRNARRIRAYLPPAPYSFTMPKAS